MLEWYILSVIGFAVAFDQHRTMMQANHAAPASGLIPIAVDAAAWIGGMATLGLLIAGFFIGAWWWPFLAMAVGTVVNYTGRQVVALDIRWLSCLVTAAVGLGAGFVFLTQVL